MPTQKNEVAVKQDKIKSILDRSDIQIKIGQVMAQHMDPQKLTRVALLTINKTPKIAECTIPSLLQCIMDCARMGLEPDGRNAHLIPYGNACTLIIDFKGLIKLAKEGGAETVQLGVIREGDEYRIEKGACPVFRHSPKIGNKGPVIAAYACVIYPSKAFEFEVIEIEEIEAIRKSSRSGNNGPWVTHYNEMCKKTAFRRLSKVLNLGSKSETIERVLDVETGHKDEYSAEDYIDVAEDTENKNSETA